FGGAGRDSFQFDTAPAVINRDTILDFTSGEDRIQLDNAVMAELGLTTGRLSAAAFWASTTGLAHDASDRIIYETDTGRLYYDANGSAAGGRMMIATLTGAPTITHADFFIV
ncbi:calcium-binding protein, partial [Salmonella enterica subsp. enterica serovar Virchow]|nr:calcium-binding protein [Salmonella enterica subsp. enterica serovar Virchow]